MASQVSRLVAASSRPAGGPGHDQAQARRGPAGADPRASHRRAGRSGSLQL